MKPLIKPKPLSVTKRLLNSFNTYNLFGMVTELVQRYAFLKSIQSVINIFDKIINNNGLFYRTPVLIINKPGTYNLKNI